MHLDERLHPVCRITRKLVGGEGVEGGRGGEWGTCCQLDHLLVETRTGLAHHHMFTFCIRRSSCSPRGQNSGSPNRQETWNRTRWCGISHENRELDNHNLFYQTYENLRSPKQEPETNKTQRHSGFTKAEQFSQRGVGVWGRGRGWSRGGKERGLSQ